MKLPAKAAIRRLHMRIYAHRAIQFAHLKVRLADNIAATSLLTIGESVTYSTES